MELISEWLKLPPVLAGATLLSFGNGAPDIFTQLAGWATGSSDPNPDGVSLALTEPLAGGLFVCCLVFGLVVFFCPGHKVKRIGGLLRGSTCICPRALTKTCLAALGTSGGDY